MIFDCISTCAIHSWWRAIGAALLAATFSLIPVAAATGQNENAGAGTAVPASAAQAAPEQPVTITLEEAIRRAEANEPGFAATNAESKAAAIDRYVAKSALLPSVIYHNQGLYTQPNGHANNAGQIGQQPAPIFIANNAVREYASQAVANETIGLGPTAAVRRAEAAAARASAELEIG
ncbi:MAG: TolC family protein, partial [Terracidiphilus sp.]